MKYNLAIKSEKSEAFRYFMILSNKKAMVEVKKISPKRSLNQNAYLHLLIGAFGEHFGYEMEEAKQLYKEFSPLIYSYKKKGRTFWRSSADLTKEEMAESIDRFMRKSAENDYPLPLASDKEWLMRIENDMEKSRRYM